MAGPPLACRPLRIAIAHEWLVRYAGSERVVEELLVEFPDSQLLTTVIRPEHVPRSLRAGEPSFLQRFPGAPAHHSWLLPVMPLAWSLRRAVSGVDAVVSSSHACAKAVRVAAGIPHLCYCYTPMRYAWDFSAERERFPPGLRRAARTAMGAFRVWDRRTADRVDEFVAISRAVGERIQRSYGRPSQVIHPPVRTDFFTPGGERGDAFLYVGRLVAYKRPDLVVAAFEGLPHRLLVVGEGHLERSLRLEAPPNVEFLGTVDDETLRSLYRSARALVFPGEEDFGIVMAEAQACGTPVIALGAGGAQDIVDPGITGWLLDRQRIEDVREAVTRAATESLDTGAIRRNAERFSQDRFRREMRDSLERLVQAGTRRQ
jgi:glycosyltransferase involved in cell wall biosynthesis